MGPERVDAVVRLQRSLDDRSIVGAHVVADVADPRLTLGSFGLLDATLDAIRESSRPIPPAGLRLWFDALASAVAGRGGAAALAARLATVGLSGTPFGIRLLDSAAVDAAALIDAIEALQQRGVRVAVDATGPGGRRVDELACLGVDRFVLDETVVGAVGDGDSRASIVVQSVVGLASALPAEVIAVGTEFDAGARLHELGVAFAQVVRTEPWAPPRRAVRVAS